MPNPRKTYKPIMEKTFENALTNLFRTEFGFMGGPAVIQLIVERIVRLVDEYYPPRERVKVGQMVWFAVDADEKKGPAQSMKRLHLRPVILSAVTPTDIESYCKGDKMRSIVQKVMARMLKEAHKQKGVLSEIDIALILHRDASFISELFREYQETIKKVLPTRGTVHHLGGTETHKGIIVGKYLEGKEAPTIAKETNHTLDAVDRYLKHANQIRAALRNGINETEIPMVTGLSPRLVQTYLSLFKHVTVEKIGR
jgi:hypothetical protein